jgi:hypothetical protein
MHTYSKVVFGVKMSICIASVQSPTPSSLVLAEFTHVFDVTPGPLQSKVSEGIDFGSFEAFGRYQDSNDLGILVSGHPLPPQSPPFLSSEGDAELSFSSDFSAYPCLMSPYGKSTSRDISGGNLKFNGDTSADNFYRAHDPLVFERPTQLPFSPSPLCLGKEAPVDLNTSTPPSTSNSRLAPSMPFLQRHVQPTTAELPPSVYRSSGPSPSGSSPLPTLPMTPGHILPPITPAEQLLRRPLCPPDVVRQAAMALMQMKQLQQAHHSSLDTYCVPPRFQSKSTFNHHYGSPFEDMHFLTQPGHFPGRLPSADSPPPETSRLQLPRRLSYSDSYTMTPPTTRSLNTLNDQSLINASFNSIDPRHEDILASPLIIRSPPMIFPHDTQLF